MLEYTGLVYLVHKPSGSIHKKVYARKKAYSNGPFNSDKRTPPGAFYILVQTKICKCFIESDPTELGVTARLEDSKWEKILRFLKGAMTATSWFGAFK